METGIVMIIVVLGIVSLAGIINELLWIKEYLGQYKTNNSINCDDCPYGGDCTWCEPR